MSRTLEARSLSFWEIGPINALKFKEEIEKKGSSSVIVGDGISHNFDEATRFAREFTQNSSKGNIFAFDFDGLIVLQTADVFKGRPDKLLNPSIREEVSNWLQKTMRIADKSYIYTTRKAFKDASIFWRTLQKTHALLLNNDLTNFPVLTSGWIEQLNQLVGSENGNNHVFTNKKKLRAEGISNIITDFETTGQKMTKMIFFGSGVIDRAVFLEHIENVNNPNDYLLVDFGGYWI